MKCKETEQAIYLYQELSVDERSKVDAHVDTCEECALLLREWKQSVGLIQHAKQVQVVPNNAAHLNHRIMNAIHSTPSNSVFDLVLVKLRTQFVSYGMATMSLILVVFFISEQNQSNKAMVMDKKYSGAHDVVLNSNSFFKALQEGREIKDTFSFSSLQTCAKNSDCGDGLIENFKIKKAL